MLARLAPPFSGRIEYDYFTGFHQLNRHDPPERARASLFGSSWAFHQLYGTHLSHQGKHIEFRIQGGRGSAEPIRHTAEVGAPIPLHERVAARPPWFAGTVWYESTRSFVRKHLKRARLGPTLELNGVSCTALEWDVSPGEEAEEAFRCMGNQAGSLRIYVAPKYGYAMPMIQELDKNGFANTTYESSDFREVAPGLLFPMKTACQYFENQKPAYYERYQIKSLSNVNEPIPDKDFILEFPPETLVIDHRNKGVSFRVGRENPIPLADDLVEFVMPAAQPASSVPWWLASISLGAVLAAIVLASYVLVRKVYKLT
jgi:hypothetical protein